MPQRAIGYIIRQRRLELGLTQEDLAERVSGEDEWIKQADISRIENGQVRLPRPARLQRIADVLGLSLGELLLHASGVDPTGQLLVEQSDDDADDGAPDAGADGAGSIWDDPSPHLRLLEGLGQAVIVTDPDGTIRYWNAYAEHLYGWPAAEVLGRNTSDVTVVDTREWRERSEAIMTELVAGQRWSGDYLVCRRDGSRFVARVTLSPVLDRSGAVVAVFGSSYEVARSNV